MGLDNDTRGWIMTCVSGVACVFGASLICVDIVVREFPGMKDFDITESDAFLSASLSLSFGVMVSVVKILNAKQMLTIRGSSSLQCTACFLSLKST